VGATCAFRIAEKGYADVVLIELRGSLRARDWTCWSPIIGSDARIIGSNRYEETANSDIMVITSGVARKPGMSRDDLVLTNKKIVQIVQEVVTQVVQYSPDCIIIMVANPLMP